MLDARLQKRSCWNVITAAVAAFVLFSAYNTLQGYATSLLPSDTGNACLAIIYGSVVIGIHFAAPLIELLGTRLALVASASLYVVFMFSLLGRAVTAVILVAAFLAGVGAAIFWVAVGAHITQNSLSPHEYGRNTGLFWSIFQCCNIAGNLVAYFVFRRTHSDTDLFIVFGCVGAAGTALLCALKPPPSLQLLDSSARSCKAGAAPAQQRLSLRALFSGAWVSAKTSLALLLTRRGLLFTPMFFFSGLELGFWSGTFPTMLAVDTVGLVMTFAGVGEVLGGWVFGKLGDVSRTASMLGGGVLYGAGLGLSVALRSGGAPAQAPSPVLAGASLLSYLAAFLLGAGDSSFNCNTYAAVSAAFNDATVSEQLAAGGSDSSSGRGEGESSSDDAEAPLLPSSAAPAPSTAAPSPTSSVPAFVLFQLVQNLGSCLGFFYGIPLPLTGSGSTLAQIWAQAGTGVLALVTFALLDARYLRKHKGDNTK